MTSGDHDQWFFAKNGQRFGPFSSSQARELLLSNFVSVNDWAYKRSFKDWQRIMDVTELVANNHDAAPKVDEDSDRRQERLQFDGSIVMHNKQSLIVCRPVDISKSGIFLLAESGKFSIGEAVNLTIKSSQLPDPINIGAKVVRISKDPSGYGLQFEGEMGSYQLPVLKAS